jgi:deoxyribonuclease-2
MISPLNNEKGEPVDWWFAYKLPMDVGPNSDSTGFEFLYCDSEEEKSLILSPLTLKDKKCAISATLQQLFNKKSDVGYIMWNDEIPPSKKDPTPKNSNSKGHSKGILAFSKKTNSGFYLLHSTPRFPLEGTSILPDNEKEYGQTYLCVSFKDYKTANDIAQILLTQNRVQVYSSHLADTDTDEFISKLASNEKCETPDAPINYKFKTRKGLDFQFIAKNSHWSKAKKGETTGKDFWEDLVAPTLVCDFSVETWRRGLVFSDEDTYSKEITKDVLKLDLNKIGLKGYVWPFTKDHAKWGISETKNNALVMIADINRQISQAKRGGGGLVFKNEILWQSLSDIEKIEKEINRGVHKDSVPIK